MENGKVSSSKRPRYFMQPQHKQAPDKEVQPNTLYYIWHFFPVRVEAQGSLCECTHLGEVVWGRWMGALFPNPQFMS